ncbi:hypothetical protein REPUB_Repub02eG0118000 [Reevesia pubescens]
MVTVCQTCGDRGFSVALIYCDKCQAFAVHRYCLYKLPETFEEDVVWFCVDCKPNVVESSTLQQTFPATSFQSRLKDSSVRRSKGKNDFKKLKKKKKKKNKNKKKSKYDFGALAISKVQSQSNPSLAATFEEHVVGLSKDCEPKVAESSSLLLGLPVSGFQSRLKDGSSILKSKGKNDIKKLKKKKKKKKKSKYDSGLLAISKVQRQNIPSVRPHENVAEDETMRRSLGVDEPSSNEEARLIEAKTPASNTCSHSRGSDLVKSDEGAESVNNRTSLVAINEDVNIIEHKFLDPGCRELDGVHSDEAVESINAKTSLVATSNQIPKHSYVPAQPIFEPIWRGNFHLSDENLTVGIIAHLSSLACLKVCEMAKCLPQLLHLELLPRCEVWPKSFEKWGPSEQSIALYFFPSNERDTKNVDCLIDKMIGRDLGMRAVVQDVELLVFTSNLLPLCFWRFQEKFYLWGVFRAKQASKVVRGEEKILVKTSTWDSRSPVSPLSDGGSSLSG